MVGLSVDILMVVSMFLGGRSFRGSENFQDQIASRPTVQYI